MSGLRTAAISGVTFLVGLALGVVIADVGSFETTAAPPADGVLPTTPADSEQDVSVDAPVPAREHSRRAASSSHSSSFLERAAAEISVPEIPSGNGQIGGFVRTASGQPVDGVELRVVVNPPPADNAKRLHDQSLEERFAIVVRRHALEAATTRSATTGEDGSFLFDGLAEAPYSITGSADGYRIVQSGNHRSRLTPDTTIDLTAVPIVRVPLDVRLADGTEPDEATVTLRSGRSTVGQRWRPGAPEVSAGPGTYDILVAAGDHKELTAEVRDVTLSHGEAPEPIAVVLESRPGIAGRLVLPPGYPAVWASVRAAPIGPETTPESVVQLGQSMHTNQHDEYRFSINDVSPGRYLLVAWRLHGTAVLASREVEVGDQMAIVDLEMAPPERSDHLEVAAFDPTGAPAIGFRVQLGFRSDRRNWSGGSTSVGRPDGTVWVEHIGLAETGGEGGTYTATVTHEAYGSVTTEYQPGDNSRIDVAFQEPAYLEVSIAGAGDALIGRELTVQAGLSRGEVVRPRGPDDDGAPSVRVGPLQPGSVSVTASVVVDRYRRVLVVQEATARRGDNEIRLTVPPLHTVRVQCTDSTAAAGRSVRLRRTGEGVRRETISATMPESGVFTFRFVLEGTYQLRVGSERRDITVSGPTTEQF